MSLVPNSPGPERNRVRTDHRIAAVRYLPRDTENSPIECQCGWAGLSPEWDDHKRDSGRRPHRRY